MKDGQPIAHEKRIFSYLTKQLDDILINGWFVRLFMLDLSAL